MIVFIEVAGGEKARFVADAVFRRRGDQSVAIAESDRDNVVIEVGCGYVCMSVFLEVLGENEPWIAVRDEDWCGIEQQVESSSARCRQKKMQTEEAVSPK